MGLSNRTVHASQINEQPVDHVDHIGEAVEILNVAAASASSSKSGVRPPPPLTLTLSKSSNALAAGPSSYQLPLSSSSSGQNLSSAVCPVTTAATSTMTTGPRSVVAAATSPIKDTIRGSQEFVRKLISSHHSGIASSSSSEKVYTGGSSFSSYLATGQPKQPQEHLQQPQPQNRSPLGLMETMKEKVKKSRSRRSSKEPMELAAARPDYDPLDKYRTPAAGGESDKGKFSRDPFMAQ